MKSDSLKEYQPTIHVVHSPDEVDMYAANTVISLIATTPDAVISLPTGSTPEGMYSQIVKAYQDHRIDFSGVTIFNLDEYWPIKKSNQASYDSYMRKHLIDHINILPQNWRIPNGEASDPAIEADRYEQILIDTPVIHLAVLGIGPGTTCHVGFNEKGSAVESTTRYVALDPQTQQANSRFFSNPADAPKGAITQGILDILQAQKILLIAKGESKAWGIKRTLQGPISSDAPASFLRYHPQVTVVIDAEAAKELEKAS